MTTARPPTMVAVFNSNPEVVQLLRDALDEHGYATATALVADVQRGREDLLAFLTRFDPRVIVYDIGPPYGQSWTFLRLLRNLRAMQGRGLVITTINKRALAEAAGVDNVLEVLGKPYDIDELVRAVRQAAAG